MRKCTRVPDSIYLHVLFTMKHACMSGGSAAAVGGMEQKVSMTMKMVLS